MEKSKTIFKEAARAIKADPHNAPTTTIDLNESTPLYSEVEKDYSSQLGFKNKDEGAPLNWGRFLSASQIEVARQLG